MQHLIEPIFPIVLLVSDFSQMHEDTQIAPPIPEKSSNSKKAYNECSRQILYILSIYNSSR